MTPAYSTPLHRDGVPWYKAPLPRRWHRCSAWTEGSTDGGATWVERCTCGALRYRLGPFGSARPWIERNSRAKPLSPVPNIYADRYWRGDTYVGPEV